MKKKNGRFDKSNTVYACYWWVAGYFAGHLVKMDSGMALTIGIFAFIIIAFVYTGNFDINFDAITANISNVLTLLLP